MVRKADRTKLVRLSISLDMQDADERMIASKLMRADKGKKAARAVKLLVRGNRAEEAEKDRKGT